MPDLISAAVGRLRGRGSIVVTIRRRKHNANFTIVPNAIVEDMRLSVEAKGTLAYLLSRPADWTVRLRQVGKTLRMGRDKTQRVFGELKGAGYVVRRSQQRAGGRWGAREYLVLDDPTKGAPGLDDEISTAPKSTSIPADETPRPENPATVEPPTVEPQAHFQAAYKGLRVNKTGSNKIAAAERTREGSNCLIRKEAFELADELMRLQRLDPDDPRVIGAAYQVEQWLTKGWRVDVILQAVKIVMARRKQKPPQTLCYFEPVIAELHAGRDRPLPGAAPREPSHAQISYRPEDWRSRRDAQHAARAKLRNYIESLDGSGSEGNGQIIQLVPNAGLR
jgi:hypothetical protein